MIPNLEEEQRRKDPKGTPRDPARVSLFCKLGLRVKCSVEDRAIDALEDRIRIQRGKLNFHAKTSKLGTPEETWGTHWLQKTSKRTRDPRDPSQIGASEAVRLKSLEAEEGIRTGDPELIADRLTGRKGSP